MTAGANEEVARAWTESKGLGVSDGGQNICHLYVLRVTSHAKGLTVASL